MAKTIKLHKYQKKAIFSEKRITAAIAGLQSGKTFSGAIWLRMMVSRFREPWATFIVAFPTYSIWQSSTLPAFMRLFSDLGTLVKSPVPQFKMNHGATVYFRSMDNPWSCEGITNCKGIWLDEGGLVSTQSFINLMGRAAPLQAPIYISTTPYNLNNYLFRDLYEPWRSGERTDIEIIQFTSADNPYFSKEEYERQRSLLDPRMFAMRYQGQFERMAGLVYSDFNRYNYRDAFTIDRSRYHIFAGIDWGYTDPYAITVRAINRDGSQDYQISEYYKTGQTPDEQMEVAKQFQQTYGIERFYADSADPGLIAHFSKGGVRISAVSNKAINYGISLHNSIIRTNVHQIFRGKCPWTEKEYESYQYKTYDIDGTITDNKPLDLNNHLMDANRYVTVETQWIRDKSIPNFVPAKTHLQQLLAGEFSSSKGDDFWD
jgi:PBSX family phage terminase large subunit